MPIHIMSTRDKSPGPSATDATTVGIDISHLSRIQVYGEDKHGQVAVQANFSRGELLNYFEKAPPCVVGIAIDEAYAATARYWKKKLEALHHTVNLMAMEFVRSHSQAQDAVNARAICKAVQKTV
jgi:transposase